MANPPPVPLLRSLAATAPQKKDVQLLRMFLLLLWEKVGGGSDPISELENKSKIFYGMLNKASEIYTHSVSADYTTVTNEHVRVTAACTITLNESPDEAEKVTVENIDGSRIIIDGGSNTISGQEKIITLRKNTLLCFTYRVDLGEWVLG